MEKMMTIEEQIDLDELIEMLIVNKENLVVERIDLSDFLLFEPEVLTLEDMNLDGFIDV